MKLVLFSVGMLFSCVVHAQSSCPQSGTLGRYEEARDQHLPAQDGGLGAGARHMVEVAYGHIYSGIQGGLVEVSGLGPIGSLMPILQNVDGLTDGLSPDPNVKVEGALKLLNGTVLGQIKLAHVDDMARNMLYGLQGDPSSYVGEAMDAVNRRQVYRAGCKDGAWTLPRYDPRNMGPLYEPTLQCSALNINFDPMLSQAVDRGGITETIPGELESGGSIKKVVICAESGSSPSTDPNSNIPDFDLTASVYMTYYLTRQDALADFGQLHDYALTTPEYEPRQAQTPIAGAFGSAYIGEDPLTMEQKRIGAAGYYYSRNLVMQMLYYSQYWIVSSVPDVSVEQQMAQQIISGAPTQP